MAEESRPSNREEAARLGVTVRHFQRLKAREREGMAEWMTATAGPAPEWDDLDPFDYPYMELVIAAPADSRHAWCQIDPAQPYDPGAASADWGRFHLGRGIRSLTGGHIDWGGEGPPEPKSDKNHVTPADREKHVVWVQLAPETEES